MGLATQGDNISVYKVCIKDIKIFKSLINPLLFSNSNMLNLKPISKGLPLLTRVKEIIIARIYIYL